MASNNPSAVASAAIIPTLHTRSYDPNIIIRAANEKLAAGDLAGGQTLFQSALLNWVDDAREGIGAGTMDHDSLKEAIATLWIAYSHYLQRAKQFKSATEALEQAVGDPIGGTVGRVWLEYARFLQERNKPRSAQQIYLRALGMQPPPPQGGSGHQSAVVLIDEQDQNLLWQEFLELSRTTTNNQDLTLAELQQAIQEEQQQQQQQHASEDETGRNSPLSKRPRLGLGGVATSPGGSGSGNLKMEFEDDEPVFRTHVVTSQDVELEVQTLTETMQSVANDPTFMAAWLVRDGDAPPQPPHPALFEPAPPKLSDPTGKDLLGETLALAVVGRLLEPSGHVVLQVCRGLWMWTLLKEQATQKSVDDFDEVLRTEYQQLQARLEERLSVAGAAEAAVRTMNEAEIRAFQTQVQEKRESLVNSIGWELRQLQWASQQVLFKLQMPAFTEGGGTTVDATELETQSRVCAYLHSAFFLRRRIGDKAHDTMLQSQYDRLTQYVQEGGGVSRTPPRSSRAGGGSRSPLVPPMAGGNLPPPPINYGGPPPPPPPQYGGGGMMMLPPPPTSMGYAPMGYPGYPPQQQQQQQQYQQLPPPYNQGGAPPPPPPPQYR